MRKHGAPLKSTGLFGWPRRIRVVKPPSHKQKPQEVPDRGCLRIQVVDDKGRCRFNQMLRRNAVPSLSPALGSWTSGCITRYSRPSLPRGQRRNGANSSLGRCRLRPTSSSPLLLLVNRSKRSCETARLPQMQRVGPSKRPCFRPFPGRGSDCGRNCS